MTFHFVPIPKTPKWLADTRQHWMPFLPKIAQRSKENLDDMIEAIATFRIQLALVWNEEQKATCAIVGMQYRKVGEDLVAELIWLTGRGMKEWRTLLPELEKFLKESEGVTLVRPICRPGWEPY